MLRYLQRYMNIFLNLKAEDALRLREFLKKNPSVKSTGVNLEHLDAGIIARVVFNLENGLNQM